MCPLSHDAIICMFCALIIFLYFIPVLDVRIHIGLLHLMWNPVVGVIEFDVIYYTENNPEDRQLYKTVNETILRISLKDVLDFKDFFLEASIYDS